MVRLVEQVLGVLEALEAMVSNEEWTITKVATRINMQRKRRLRRSQRGKH
jgi:hypothetical protein